MLAAQGWPAQRLPGASGLPQQGQGTRQGQGLLQVEGLRPGGAQARPPGQPSEQQLGRLPSWAVPSFWQEQQQAPPRVRRCP